jgi:acetyl esterase
MARSIPKPAAAPEPVVAAEFDPLRDEGGAYATRLRDSGVPAVISYEGQVHGFMGFMGAVADAEVPLSATADTIAAHFG